MRIDRQTSRRALFAALALLFAALPACAGGDSELFWSLSRDGRPAGYLLGTIHSEDPRVLEYSDDFIDRLNECPVFAMELVPDLPTLARLAEYMNLPVGTQLADVIGVQRFEAVTATLARYHVPAAQVARMKPWAAMMTLSVPPPKSGFFMDFSLSLRAAGSGSKVIGLETLDEQLAFLEDMSMEQQIELLDEALNEFDQVQIVHDEMVMAYLSGKLDELQSEAMEQMGTLSEETRDYFMSEGIDARNLRMKDALLPRLAEDCVFVAVGALHLPGPQGLVTLLREEGLTVTPRTSPFAVHAESSGDAGIR